MNDSNLCFFAILFVFISSVSLGCSIEESDDDGDFDIPDEEDARVINSDAEDTSGEPDGADASDLKDGTGTNDAADIDETTDTGDSTEIVDIGDSNDSDTRSGDGLAEVREDAVSDIEDGAEDTDIRDVQKEVDSVSDGDDETD